jgi:hypothetical protein
MAFETATVITNGGKGLSAAALVASGTTPKYLALGTGATSAARTASASDTALSAELTEGRSGTNAPSTTTTTNTNDTFTCTQSVTATGTRVVDELGFFTAPTAGTMAVSATIGVVTLNSGDSLTVTGKYQFS